MEILNQIASRIDLFLLIMARIGGIFTTGPVYSNRAVPRQVRVLMTVLISMIVVAGVRFKMPAVPSKLEYFIPLLAGEMIIGMIIGFVAQFTFAAVQFAGQSLDMQMGFGITNVIDPLYGTQAPLMGSFQNLLALLLFLATNSHHYMIAALFQSYQKIPIFGLTGQKEVYQVMIDLFGNMLVTGVKIAIPVVGALFVAEVALGMIARTMPEMQVYFVGIPAKIVVGLLLLIMILPIYMTTFQFLFDRDYQDTMRILEILG